MSIRDQLLTEFSLNSVSRTALYAQLATFFRQKIKSGQFKAGDQMVPENELCQILRISRTTVRLAMNELLEEGLIIRFRGKGSFVAEDKIRRKLDSMYNFTDSMLEQRISPSSRVLSASIVSPDALTCEKLMLTHGQNKVFQLVRLRCGNGVPLLLEKTHIPVDLCAGIERTDFSNSSLYNVLKVRFGLDIYHAVETLEAIIISNDIASLLECEKKHMPGYKIERQSKLGSGRIFEYTTSVTRADRCSFRIDLYSQTGSRPTVDFSRKLKA